jgi:hypothetical protein
MTTQSQSEEIKKLKAIILELIEVIQGMSIDRYGSIEKDTKTLYQIKELLQD